MHVAGLGASTAVLAGAGFDRGGWLLPFSLAAAALTAAAAARSWALRVEVGHKEVVLVNWLRVVRLPWSEVARCGHDEEGIWVRRVDGSEVRASAFQHGHRALGFAREPAAAAAKRLETIRRKRRRP